MACLSDSDSDLTRPNRCQEITDRKKETPSKFGQYRSPTLNDAGEVFKQRRKSEKSWKWILTNLIGVLVFYFGVLQRLAERYFNFSSQHLIYADYLMSFYFLWNTLVNLYIYLLPSLRSDIIAVSPQQQKLFKIRDTDKSFAVRKSIESISAHSTPVSSSGSWPKRRISSRTTPGGSILTDVSPEKTPTSQYTPTSRLDYRISQSSSTKATGRPIERTPTTSPSQGYRANTSASSLKSFQVSPGRSPASKDKQIFDAESLDKYLKTQEEKETIIRRAQLDSNHSSPQSFWSYGREALDFIPIFGSYQLATRSPQASNLKDEELSSANFDYEKLWRNLKISREDLELWTEKLRKWLAETIIEKLVAEISNVNDTLVQNGCPELQIGTLSVNSLRNVAAAKAQLLPSLQSVIPYLDVTANQEYLVNRLEELSTGGCLRLYKWDSGGSFKGKAWDQELPTDAQIIAHLFCTYMDTHLPSNPRYPDGNSFSGLHFLKPPSKPSDKKSEICIMQTRTHPPHFKVIKSDDTHDIPMGRHNLFCAISVFLYLVKIKYHGMLERVNLGMSGINVLWILNK